MSGHWYGQHTSSRFPTSRVSKGGGSIGCNASHRSETPCTSRRSRATSALAFRLATLKSAVASMRSASASAVPRSLMTCAVRLRRRSLRRQLLHAAQRLLVRQDVLKQHRAQLLDRVVALVGEEGPLGRKLPPAAAHRPPSWGRCGTCRSVPFCHRASTWLARAVCDMRLSRQLARHRFMKKNQIRFWEWDKGL